MIRDCITIPFHKEHIEEIMPTFTFVSKVSESCKNFNISNVDYSLAMLRAPSHDVTLATLVPRNNEMAAMFGYHTYWELNTFVIHV